MIGVNSTTPQQTNKMFNYEKGLTNGKICELLIEYGKLVSNGHDIFRKQGDVFFRKPDKAILLLEIIGYCLSDYICAKKAFFFVGEPSSGKSKILEFLQKLITDEDVTQIPFSMLSSRFCQGLLREKRLNICTELPSDKFPSIEVFKALTGGDRIYGELKGKDGFDYYPKVRLLSAGNNIPVPKHCDGTSSIIDICILL